MAEGTGSPQPPMEKLHIQQQEEKEEPSIDELEQARLAHAAFTSEGGAPSHHQAGGILEATTPAHKHQSHPPQSAHSKAAAPSPTSHPPQPTSSIPSAGVDLSHPYSLSGPLDREDTTEGARPTHVVDVVQVAAPTMTATKGEGGASEAGVGDDAKREMKSMADQQQPPREQAHLHLPQVYQSPPAADQPTPTEDQPPQRESRQFLQARQAVQVES